MPNARPPMPPDWIRRLQRDAIVHSNDLMDRAAAIGPHALAKVEPLVMKMLQAVRWTPPSATAESRKARRRRLERR